jgi:uncharacterized protein YuzE
VYPNSDRRPLPSPKRSRFGFAQVGLAHAPSKEAVLRFWGIVARRPRFSRGQTIKLHYYADTDSLYIELNETPGTETREVAAGLVVDLDAKGDVVGFDIDGASRRFDLSTLETIALPLKTTKAA